MNDSRLEPIFEDLSIHMDTVIDHTMHEFAKIRAGKANPAMLESLRVDYYGNSVPINQVGSVNTPDAKTIVIQPWEKAMIQPIEKAIMAANLGFNPTSDGTLIRIILPPLTEDRRREIVKKVKAEAEHAKISARNVRKEVNETIKKLQKDGLPEDDAKDAEAKVQKTTDSYIKKIDELTASKEAEIMHV